MMHVSASALGHPARPRTEAAMRVHSRCRGRSSWQTVIMLEPRVWVPQLYAGNCDVVVTNL
jgi:hypothetical protein